MPICSRAWLGLAVETPVTAFAKNTSVEVFGDGHDGFPFTEDLYLVVKCTSLTIENPPISRTELINQAGAYVSNHTVLFHR